MHRKTILWIGLFSAAVAAGAMLRLHDVRHRPMHADEAVHAFQFGGVLENGVFRYDPLEYHGPSLIFFTAVPAWIRGEKSLDRTDETTFRIVPVLFGLGLILLLPLLSRGLGTAAAVSAAIWTALSAPLVFYSRYYIHEIPFVFFGFCALACGTRYLRAKTWTWAALFGASAGWMHATKETCVLVWGAAAVALALVRFNAFVKKDDRIFHQEKIPFRHMMIAAASAAGISILMFSSFFRNPEGIIDSLRAFFLYFKRFSASSVHDHPWTYYMQLFFRHDPGRPVWTEVPVLVFAGLGAIGAFRTRRQGAWDGRLARFLVFHTVILSVLVSAIAYKTPWCALGFYHGCILLAGLGTASLLRWAGTAVRKTAAGLLLVIAFAAVLRQSILLNGRYDFDPCNPWVYAQTLPDVFSMVGKVETAAAESAGPVVVIMPGHGYWPLPWYFRKMKNVGWFGGIQENMPAASVILIAPELEQDLLQALHAEPPGGREKLYISLWKEELVLRPGVEVRGYQKIKK